MNWQDQVCLITGATGGIGKEIARQLSQLGATLILHGRNEVTLRALLNELNNQRHSYVIADLATEVGVDNVFNAVNQHGGLTMLINNAGVSGFGLFEQTSNHQINKVIGTNLTATISLTLRLLPLLKLQSHSYLVNVGSVFGSIGYPSQALYCASKFGIKGFSESLYRELHGTGVNVHYFAPRATDTTINAGEVSALNKALGTKVDSPVYVAQELIQQINKQQPRKTLGWPERLFVKINAVFPSIVDSALVKQLPIIKRYANFAVSEAKI
ncbi:SDR family oxidoreductase [Aestuariibacter sp. GS-14]|uniref:SDR family oxidoreductase n=1 Tax=Aestuariibacter sp. GS-14 TaxID=2590670 RepID=UPI001129FCF4|nr:SDR family oxidoreductase [Aestuariibacter sp. GS-14]TPV59959.1 SDR family oxidoreductase [Aestuariibacter sp. GS-14]